MDITFLGTSAGTPTARRNVSGIVLQLPQRSDLWLFDCGEGTQHRFMQSSLRFSRVSRIFLSHLHGDHLFGLPGFLATCSLAGDSQAIKIYGPKGLERFLKMTFELSDTHLGFPIIIHEIEPGCVVDDQGFTVISAHLAHRIEAFGYRIHEPDQPGTFDVAAAAALNIPAGPLYGRLKQGESVTLDDGRVIHGADFCGPVQRGRSIAICTDTSYTPSAVELACNVDLLIHEATFSESDHVLATRSQHSTTVDAARVALEANANRLILTHISPRYSNTNPISAKDLLAEARKIFAKTDLAEDLLEVNVGRT